MLEINLLSLVYTGLVALGIIGAQAALSKKNFVLTVSSTADLTKEGYSREVIEALFLNEIERVVRTRSVITGPSVNPANEKTLVAAFADMLHMGEISYSMQRAMGNAPNQVRASFVHDNGKLQALIIGDTYAGDFQRVVTSKGEDVRVLVRTAAHVALRIVDPYFVALNHFELGLDGSGVEAMADEELARARGALTPMQRAAFHNLKGLVRLERNDKVGALAAFDAAFAVDSRFSIAHVNRAFTLIALDRHTEAVAAAQQVLSSTSNDKIDRIDQVFMAARMIIAVSKWAHGDRAGAEADFVMAARESPTSTTPLLTWSRILLATGQRDPSVEKLLAARTAAHATDEMYAEIAMLYFTIGGEDRQQMVERRIVRKPNPRRSTPVPAGDSLAPAKL